MAQKSRGLVVAVVYLGGVVALCIVLGRAAGSLWTALAVLAAILGIHVAVALAASDHPGWALAVATLSLTGLAVAGAQAEHAGRWWWSVPWALSALWMFVTATRMHGTPRWFRVGASTLGVVALACAFVAPLWLYEKSPEETAELVADLVAGRELPSALWALAVPAAVALAVLVVVASTRGRDRRSRRGTPRPDRSRRPTPYRPPGSHPHGTLAPWWVVVLLVLGIGAGVVAWTESSNLWPLAWTAVLILPVVVYWVATGLGRRHDHGGSAAARIVLAGLAVAGLAVLSVSVIGALRLCTTNQVPGGDLTGCDLAGSDLAGTDLAGADLSGAILSGADLTGADLRKAVLVGADLTDATLTDAALTGAVLGRTDLSGSTGLSDPALAALLGTDETGLPWALSSGEIRLEDRDAVLAAAGAVCTGGTPALAPPGGVAVAGFHPIVAVDASGQPGDWSDGPAEAGWEPMATRFTDLVACVGDEVEEAVEECAYSGGSPITRYVHVQES